MSLFDDFNRTYDGPASYNEDRYHFFNRSARPASACIRETLETWFTHYPDNNKTELKARFQSESDSAFYELFLHELFLKIGCEVVVHPRAGDRSKTRPDFLAKFPCGDEAFVEAVLSQDESEEERASRARLDALFDEVNKVKSPDFFLNVLSVKNPQGIQPSGRKLRRLLSERLNGLNPDGTWETLTKYGIDAMPKWTFSDRDFALEVAPMPKSPEARGKPGHRLIGVVSEGVHWGGSAAGLRSSITAKAKQHGRFNKPYVIAVNSLSKWGTDEDDISEAFYGGGGIFTNYSRVSAVLVTKVYPSNVPRAPMCLYHNPFAANPCTGLLWRVSQGTYHQTKLEVVKGVSIGEVMGLPSSWPKSSGE